MNVLFNVLLVKSFVFFLLILSSLGVFARPDTIHLHEGLKVVRLSKHTWLHISYIPYEGQRIPCNGIVYTNDGVAAILDTPVDDDMSLLLIHWIETKLKAKPKYLIVNHFHEDCLGGLAAFMDHNVETFSQRRTCKLAKNDGFGCTLRYFEDTLSLNVGNEKIECWYPGEAHTVDNIVVYIPSERLLFGGCMLKAMGAGKGNLSDANVGQWSATLTAVKNKYTKAKVLVPGHGNPGDQKLLDYTIKMFQ